MTEKIRCFYSVISYKGLLLRFCLTKGSLYASKVPYNRVLFCSKLKCHPWKMHILPTSKVNFFSSLQNHTFWGTWCWLFLKFALKKGQIFGGDAPYQRVWNPEMPHPCTKIGEEPPLPGIPHTPHAFLILWLFCDRVDRITKYVLIRSTTERPRNDLASSQCKY